MIRTRFFISFCLCFFTVSGLSSCSSKGPDVTRFGLADPVICADLGALPQDLAVYALRAGNDVALMTPARQGREDERYNERFFAPWTSGLERLTKEHAFEAVAAMDPTKGFAENLRPYDADRWNDIVANCFMEGYGTIPVRHAITVSTAHLRRMPTDAPYFENPDIGGEGFPFDYMQNSVLWTATPVAVTHVSRDQMWAFVETHFISGWTRVSNLAVVDSAFMKTWRSRPLAAIVRDNVDLIVVDQKRDAVSGQSATVPAHMGVIVPFAPLPRNASPPNSPHALVNIPMRDAEGKAVIAMALSPIFATARKPMLLTPEAVARVGNAMMGQPYGWGGMFGQRDCSAAMRDLFAPFGIWLPRNSGQQGRIGSTLDVSGLSPDQKEARIMRDGVPFFSLVSMKGHVGLYLGAYPQNGREVPVMFHNIWGLRVMKGWGRDAAEERAVIGKAVVTTMRPGVEHSNISTPAGLLDRIAGLAVLPDPFPGENPAERSVPAPPRPGELVVPEQAP